MRKEVLLVLVISLFIIAGCQVPVGQNSAGSTRIGYDKCDSYNKFGTQAQYACVQNNNCLWKNGTCAWKGDVVEISPSSNSCSDGTLTNQCSNSEEYGMPYLCNTNFKLIEDCFKCGCGEGSRCTAEGTCMKDTEGINVYFSTDKDIYYPGERIRLSSTGREAISNNKLTVKDILPPLYAGKEEEITSIIGSDYISSMKRSDFNGYIVVFNEPSGLEYKKNLESVRAKRVNGSIGGDIASHVNKLKATHSSVLGNGNTITGNAAGNSISIKAEYYSVLNGVWIDGNPAEIERLKKDTRVKSITPSYLHYTMLTKSVHEIKADNLVLGSEKTTLTGKGVKVAIIDTGIDYEHEDFGKCTKQQIKSKSCPKIIDGYDFTNGDNDPFDDNGHGTHVASTVAGNGNLKGVAPEASLMIYKVLDSHGSGSEGEIIAGIERAIDPNQDFQYDDRADIISMSLGGPAQSPPDQDTFNTPINNAISVGTIVVIAAGNSGPGLASVGSPAILPKVISVGASCLNEQLWENEHCQTEYPHIADFSSRGPAYVYDKPDIVAPGVDICAAKSSAASADFGELCLDGKYIMLSGTSMATPHVSGAIALVKEAHPDWDNEMMKNALKDTAKSFGYPRYVQGSGLIDVEDTLGFDKSLNIGITGIGGGEYEILDGDKYESF